MCGIAGIRKYGDKPIEEIMIRLFLTGMEKRGNDATGMAMQNAKGEIFTLKDDTPAWTFVASNAYKDWINKYLADDIEQVILHTRAATKGNPRQSENNHPLYNGKCAVVHNGKIENDEELFKRYNLERKAETDTDIIRALADKYGVTDELYHGLEEVRGSAAIAVLDPQCPGKMIFGRSGSPLSIGSTDDFFCFASEKHIIHRAMRPWIKRFGVNFQKQSLEMGFSPFPDHTLWLMGPNGQERYGEFKSFWGIYREPVRRVYIGYKERQDKWTKEAAAKNASKSEPVERKGQRFPVKIIEKGETKIMLSCPHCNKPLVLNENQITMDLTQLLCPKSKGGCGKPLSDKPRVN